MDNWRSVIGSLRPEMVARKNLKFTFSSHQNKAIFRGKLEGQIRDFG
jgi:hypothetical protein